MIIPRGAPGHQARFTWKGSKSASGVYHRSHHQGIRFPRHRVFGMDMASDASHAVMGTMGRP